MKKNNNVHYTAIHYEQFKRLLELAGNDAKARFLDKIVYWFKTSTFTLPRSGSSEIWFTRTYEQMHADTNIPISTLKMYMKEFVQKGYVERKQKKMGISVRAYFRITKRLTSLLPANEQSFNNQPTAEKKLSQGHTSKNTTSRLPITKDKDVKKDINTITALQACGKHEKRYNVPKSVNEIFKRVGERLTETQKTTIWGAVWNLQHKHHKKISNLAEFVAWICFSILNAKHQLKSAMTFHHQLNRLMKIARTKEGLQQPRGFNNHWDIGKSLKSKQEQKARAHKSVVHDRAGELGSFVVAKKAKELWTDDGELKVLKAEKARVMMIRASIESEKKAVRMLFANDREKVDHELRKFEVKKAEVSQQVDALELKIKKLEESKQHAVAQTWEPLYA